MFKRSAACALLIVGSLVLAVSISPVWAMPSFLKPKGCGLCWEDDDCGTDHKCCRSDCPDGEYKCLKVATCPKKK